MQAPKQVITNNSQISHNNISNGTNTTIISSHTKQYQSISSSSYIFQTQTRKLKQYYVSQQNNNKLLHHRIIFNNSSGTARYIGGLKHQGKPNNSQNQLWIGIQYDEKDRGKHNGIINGCKYFQCSNFHGDFKENVKQCKYGSLVKFEKIQFGYKLETALFRRYFRAQQLHQARSIYENLKQLKKQMKQKNEELTQQHKKQQLTKKIHKVQFDEQANFATLNKNKKIMVQFVGFDEIWIKINNLQKLQSISLAQCRICSFGSRGHLTNILSNLKQLSLQDNLISNWQQIFQLGLELQNLQQLSLTNNKIASYDKYIEDTNIIQLPQQCCKYQIKSAKQIFPKLKCIILINTCLTWKSLFYISAAFQSTIEQLILCKNNMNDIQNINEQKINKFINLAFLNLQMINISSFQAVRKFKSLPKLQKLILNHNEIKQFQNIEGFNNLKHLSIQFCEIDNPIVLYQLSKLKQLQSLNIKNNPVGQRLGNSYIRMRAVAEINKLNIINGTLLKKYERKDCEIYYMRQTFREYFAFKKVPDYDYDYKDFIKYCETRHPNIERFVKKYGNPYQVEEKKQIKEIIKDEVQQNQIKKGTGMIQIFIKNKDMESVEQKKVPLSWTISNLKNFFAKVHKIPVNLQKLQVQLDDKSAIQEITQDHKNIGFYNVKNGSSIIISRRV